MADSVELKIKVTGGQEAIRELERLENLRKDLERNRIELKIKKDTATEQIHDLQKQIREVKEELEKSPKDPELLERLEKLQDDLVKAQEKARGLQDELNFNADSTKIVDEHIDEMKEHAEAAVSVFEDLGHAIENLGNFVSFLGDVSGFTADFAGAVSDAFGGMSDLFSFDFFDKITDSLANAAADAFVGDFEKIVSRYDIMNTFVDYMKVAGVNEDTANSALSRINTSILGIPIGLDEAAFRLRKYQMFLDDIDKATNLTIGVQNAIMAGGANQQMKTLAFTQIDRLIATGKLNNPRQWISLFNGLGVSLKYVAQEMGVTGMSAQELADGLANNDIPVQDFLDALARIGEGSSAAGQEITKLLDLYRTQAQSWLENIGYAATRGAVNVMDALDEVLMEKRGTNIVSYLEKVRDAINSIYGKPNEPGGITGWIEANPDKVETGISAIERLFGAFGNFDLEKFGEGAFDNLVMLMNIITEELGRIPDGKAEEFASFATTLAGPMSEFLEKAGDMPWMLSVYNEFKDHDFQSLVDKTLNNAQAMQELIEWFLGLFTNDQLDSIVAFGSTWGQPLADTLHAVGSGLATFGTALAAGKYLGALDWIAANAGPILFGAAAIGSLAAAIGYLFQEENLRREDIRESLGLNEVQAIVDATNEMSGALKKSRDDYESTVNKINGEAESTKELIKKIRELNEEVQKSYNETGVADPEALAKLNEALDEFNGLPYEDITQKLTAYSGGLNEASQAVLDNVEAEVEAQKKRAEALAAQEFLIDSSKKILELRGQVYTLQQEQQDLSDSVLYTENQMQAAIDKYGNGDVHRIGLEGTAVLDELGLKREEKQKELDAVEQAIANAKEEINKEIELRNYVLQVDVPVDLEVEPTTGITVSPEETAADIAEKIANSTDAVQTVAEILEPIADGTTAENVKGVAEAVGELNTAVGGEENGVSFLSALGAMQETLKTVEENDFVNFISSIGDVKTAFEELEKQIDEHTKKAIENLAQTMIDKTPTLESFKGKLYEVSSAAFAASEMVDILKASIDALEDKTVTVTYNEVHNVSEVAVPMYEADGGPIYLARGGGPRGTDTIPAWLTPGEFVMRRKAVNTFGSRFMAMVNDLNIQGVISELMSRAMMPNLGSIISYDNRRTYDDHSTKNINVHTNSPAYAMRFASRYV